MVVTAAALVWLSHAILGRGLLVTGDTAPDRILEAESSGFLLLHKPVAPARLAAVMRALLVEDNEGQRRERAPSS